MMISRLEEHEVVALRLNFEVSGVSLITLKFCLLGGERKLRVLSN